MSEHELWNELGNLYFLSGEYGQAVHAYRRSIQLDEGFGRPYSNLALTYVQQGKYDLAVDLYRRSIELLAERKEKAISWNRLGNVFRHLKDYKQAVEAYRNADELDPENGEGTDAPGWLTEPAHVARQVVTAPAAEFTATQDPFPYTTPDTETEPTADGAEDPSATWAPMDPSLFQQDTFEALDPGTLTTWGDPNLETEDPDADWPPDPGTEVYFPDIESDDLTKWIPIPEEQPLDSLEYSLEAVDLAAEMAEPCAGSEEAEAALLFSGLQPEPPDPVREQVEAEPAELLSSPQPKPPAPVGEQVEVDKPTAIAALLPAIIDTHTSVEGTAGASVTTSEVDVIVQERPTTEFMLSAAAEEAPAAVSELAEEARVEEQAEVVTSDEPDTTPDLSAASMEPQRDPDELHEIEIGLAKYKRVVQVNPKNARAWDTLGNLYKSAGQYKEALLAYQQAIENDSSKALFHHHLGLVYACEGSIDEAIDAFQRVIEIDPDHALAHAALGGYYRKKGLEELAQKHVGIAMKSIYDSENEYNRACLAAICGNTDQALDLLRVALKNKQTYVDWILRDPDLDFIRQDPRFKQLISDYAR